MADFLGVAADWLENGRPGEGDAPMCAYHRDACAMGTQPLSDLYTLVIEAKQRMGETVPPLDEHRPMTSAERARDAEEFAGLLADARARNEAAEAEIRGEQQ